MTLIAGLFVLAGCSSVPDYANPVEWYKGVAGWFEGEEETRATAEAAEAEPAPGASQPYPELSSVPPKPEPSSAEEREQAMQGLVADREQARYLEGSKTPPAPVEPAAGPAPGSSYESPLAPSSRTTQRQAARSAQPSSSAQAAPPPRQQVATVPPEPMPSSPATAPRSTFRDVFQQRLQESAPTASTLPTWARAETGRAAGGVTQTAERPKTGPPEGTAAESGPGGETSGFTGALLVPPSASVYDGRQSGVSVQVGTIHFARGSASLSAKDRRLLRQIVRMHRERGGEVRVVGHASSWTRDLDPATHQMVNFDVSVRRAEAVANELVRLGVKLENLVVSARSDNAPIYYEVMPAGEAGNRRTEIYLEY